MILTMLLRLAAPATTIALMPTLSPLQVYNQADLMAAMTEGLAARSNMVADGGRKIVQLLNDSHEKVRVGRASPEWRAYSDWIASIVIDGLRASTIAGLRYMLSQVQSCAVHAAAREPP